LKNIPSPADKLRQLLNHPDMLLMPGCHDAMSAKICAQAGFKTAFMSGFAVSAVRLGLPDTGLISYAELIEQGRNICNAVDIPIFGDGDTGFGNPINIKRTVNGYAQAGFACIMLEDQVMPKRCGHTKGKQIVSRDEAFLRIQAAVDARDAGSDILIMARTDARTTHGIDEAIYRAKVFTEIGADITFVEAPATIKEMEQYCHAVPGYKMVNLIENGKTPLLPHDQLAAIGYKIAVYPLTMLNVSIKAMQEAAAALINNKKTHTLDFEQLKSAVGFPEYYASETHYNKFILPRTK
jgi:2-methylisocitrate lyase-like PEP mutase family enzyme